MKTTMTGRQGPNLDSVDADLFETLFAEVKQSQR
jgi:hypothetical protein